MISAKRHPCENIITFYNSTNKLYNKNMNELLVQQITALANDSDKLSFICNVTAAIYQSTERINWAGFYFYKQGMLRLGPFQGKVACTEIPLGKGVCGTAFEKKMLLNIIDVHRFAGHIACDPDSNSEIVVPLIYNGKRMGVLDIDSPEYRRFDSDDEETFEEIAKIVSKKLAD